MTVARLALGCFGLAVLAACHDTPHAIVGVSPPRQPDRGLGLTDAAAVEPSPVDPHFKERMKKVGDRFLSIGHGQRFDAVLWVNEPAQSHWDDPEGMPDGSMLIEETMVTEAAAVHAGGLLVMMKGASGWRYLAVGTDGNVIRDAGMAACDACHREAHGSIFSFSGAPAATPGTSK